LQRDLKAEIEEGKIFACFPVSNSSNASGQTPRSRPKLCGSAAEVYSQLKPLPCLVEQLAEKKGGFSMVSTRCQRAALAGALLSGCLLAVPAAAAEKTSGFYVGGGVGQAKAMKFGDACAEISRAGAAVSDCDDKGFAFKAYGGYQFVRYFGVELGYVQFGRARAKVSSPAVGDVDFKTRGVFLDGVVTVPIIDRVSFIARAGALRWNAKVDVSGALGIANQSDSGLSGLYGAGFEYMFNDSFGMRAEYEIYENVGNGDTTGETHIHMFSVNGLLRF
jgi:OmpA-OmpF porin, OOP family